MNSTYSMHRNTSLRAVFALVLASLLLGAAVVLTTSALADSSNGHKGTHGHNGKGQAKHKMYVFRGLYNADGSVNVTSGNGRVRKHNLVGTVVTFDYANAKFSVADCLATDCPADADDVGNEQSDVRPGDTVLVQAKLGNQDPGPQPFAAKRLNDLTYPPA